MGLNERRAAKQFQETRYPSLREQVIAAAGVEVPIEVSWEALTIADQSHHYDESWPKVYFTPLIRALQAIALDDMGKSALKACLKKIVITNTGGKYYGDRIAHFADGVLTLDHEPTTNVDDVDDRVKGIQSVLEAKL